MSNSPTPPPPREGQRHTHWPKELHIQINRHRDLNGEDWGVIGSERHPVGGASASIPGMNQCCWSGPTGLANAARMVACWNACLPFASPATDVPRLIAACKPFLDAADQRADWRCRNPGWNPDAHIEITMRHSELAALLAALPPEVRP